MTAFSRFSPRLQEAIVARLGWSSLRPVQELASHAVLDGKNAVILAPTAGGKTEASIFPVLSGLVTCPTESIGALYIAPIKALLNNQEERLGTYTEMVGLRRFVWHGDAKAGDKKRFTQSPGELLMTTPESLEVMLLSSRVPTPTLFSDIKYIVIDEVHAFAGTDRGAHLMSVLERLMRFTDNDVQRIGLSATVGNPEDIMNWLQGTSQREAVVVNPPAEPSKKELLVTRYESNLAVAQLASRLAAHQKSLFFCQSRAITETIAERMRGRGIDVFVHHSSVALEERQAAEERFHRGSNACIVCTSTLELGIDVGDLDRVLQCNATSTVSSFLQRMGRTGRRSGSVANTTFFCEDGASVLQSVALIELAREKWVESIPPQTRCWPVLVHQILAMTLQFGGVSPNDCWLQLSCVPDFAGITRQEFDSLLSHMIQEDYLFETGGQLSMGQTAERVFGKKNFLELYAVFSSPVLYRVLSQAGREIGSLEQAYVDRLVEDMTSFLLGGHAWTVEQVNHEDKVVTVRPAPVGQKPSWGGFVPQLLGQEICERVRQILTDTDVNYRYVDASASILIEVAREDFDQLLKRPGFAIQMDGDLARWWTFAGGKINHTLKYALEWLEDWKVVSDNFMLRIEGDGVRDEKLRAAIKIMKADGFWDQETIRSALLARLPEYRLSKFQRAMPEWAASEMVGDYLLDFQGAARYLSPDSEKPSSAAVH